MIRPAVFAIALAAASPAFAQQQKQPPMPTKPIPLPMKSYALTDPTVSRFWTDQIPGVNPHYLGNLPPAIWAGRVKIGSDDVTVTMLNSFENCGPNQCAVRIFVNGKMTKDTLLCSATGSYAIMPNGKYLVACGDIVPLKDEG